MRAKPNTTASRNDTRNARAPAAGVAQPPRSLNPNARTGLAAIRDPYDPDGGTILATVRRNVDVLEHEYSHGRIAEAEYQVGRLIQRAFEHVPGPAGSNWAGGSRVDCATAQAHAIERYQDAAREIANIRARIIRAIGESGFHFMERILRDGRSFADYATEIGRTGDRGISSVAQRFRWHLEDLAKAWAAKGKRPSGTRDSERA